MAPRDPARGAPTEPPAPPTDRDLARGERIRRLREQRGRDQHRKVSQKEVAQAVGVTPRAYQEWEYGGELAWPNAVQLAAYHDTSADFILGGVSNGDREDPLAALDRRLGRLETSTVALASLPDLLRGIVARLDVLELVVTENPSEARLARIERNQLRIMRALNIRAPATDAPPIVPYPEAELPPGADRRAGRADRREPETQRRTGSEG